MEMTPPLSLDEIEVTPFSLDGGSFPSLELEKALLSEEERERAGRFHFAVHRERFVRGRAMLRRVLASHLEADPAALTFGTGAKGKPFLSGSPIHFNLSHSEDRAVIAVSRLPSVGIDIERFDRGVDIDGLGARCFRESELSCMRGIGEKEKRRRFFWLWTAKEARMKATGEGFSLSPQSIEILMEEGLPRKCLEPIQPESFVAPVPISDEAVACSVVALNPFSVRLARIPGSE